jgi:aerobic-type carbon monoxide dehydrogenase small subunit (CoxS/CutS family)
VNREDRLARNETLFREVNERIEQIRSDQEETIDFLCECGNTECKDAIVLNVAEYEHVRAAPTTFAVAPGHSIDEIEDVISKTERFHVVQKHPEEQHIARATDPRSGSG